MHHCTINDDTLYSSFVLCIIPISESPSSATCDPKNDRLPLTVGHLVSRPFDQHLIFGHLITLLLPIFDRHFLLSHSSSFITFFFHIPLLSSLSSFATFSFRIPHSSGKSLHNFFTFIFRTY